MQVWKEGIKGMNKWTDGWMDNCFFFKDNEYIYSLTNK